MQLHITKVLVTLKIGNQRTNIKRQKKEINIEIDNKFFEILSRGTLRERV
jgi:hypothetical protein